MMIRFLLILLLATLTILTGCASNQKTITYFDGTGKPTHSVTTDMTDSATYHHEQGQLKLAALKNRKPIARFVIPEGATLEAKGGDVALEVWGSPMSWMTQMNQYTEPFISVLEKGGPYALLASWLYQQGWGPNYDPSKQAGGSTNIYDSFNNSASGSSTGFMPGAGRDVIMSPSYRHYPTTTTTTTTGE